MIVAIRPAHAIIGIVLLATMAATRFGHFGTAVDLPDASLAVFFLAGACLSTWLWLPVFLLEAGIVDWLSVSAGTDGWCITPAYGFLIPTYASLWLAGRLYARFARNRLSDLLILGVTLGLGVSVAFAVSNGSFYLFSGYFDDLRASDYFHATIAYFPRYAGFAFMYVGIAAAIRGIAHSRSQRSLADA